MSRKSAAVAVEGLEEFLPPLPSPASITLQNTTDLRKRRQTLALAVEAARRAVDAFKEQQNEQARRIAADPRGPQAFSSGSSEAVLADELEEAKAQLAAQEAALHLVDQDIAVFESPARRESAAVARARFAGAMEQYFKAQDELESVVKQSLRGAFAEVFAARKRAAAALGAESLGVVGDMAGDAGLRRRLSQLLGGALYGLIDASALAFVAGNGFVDERAWRDVEAAHLSNLNTNNLE